MESVQLAVVRTGKEWLRFVIAAEPRKLSFKLVYWDGTKWVPERRRALLYADPALAESDLDKLQARM